MSAIFTFFYVSGARGDDYGLFEDIEKFVDPIVKFTQNHHIKEITRHSLNFLGELFNPPKQGNSGDMTSNNAYGNGYGYAN